jgi:adenylate kinase
MRTPGSVIVLLGPPGSGKGTQSALLASAAGIPEISTGEMQRRECRSGSKLGKAIEGLLAAGQLVSDDLVNQVVAKRLRRSDCRKGCILDGYPRTVRQARFLDDLLSELKLGTPVALDFQVDTEEIVARLSRRHYCAQCGRTFSMQEGVGAAMVCDRDGSVLLRRPDDNPASIRERMRLYHANAANVVDFYRRKQYRPISATRPVSEISDQLIGILHAMQAPLFERPSVCMPALA